MVVLLPQKPVGGVSMFGPGAAGLFAGKVSDICTCMVIIIPVHICTVLVCVIMILFIYCITVV